MLGKILEEINDLEKELKSNVTDEKYLRGCKNTCESVRKIIERYKENGIQKIEK